MHCPIGGCQPVAPRNRAPAHFIGRRAAQLPLGLVNSRILLRIRARKRACISTNVPWNHHCVQSPERALCPHVQTIASGPPPMRKPYPAPCCACCQTRVSQGCQSNSRAKRQRGKQAGTEYTRAGQRASTRPLSDILVGTGGTGHGIVGNRPRKTG